MIWEGYAASYPEGEAVPSGVEMYESNYDIAVRPGYDIWAECDAPMS